MEIKYTPTEIMERTDLPWVAVKPEDFKPVAGGGRFYGMHLSPQALYFEEGDWTYVKDLTPEDDVNYWPGIMACGPEGSAELGHHEAAMGEPWVYNEY